MGSDSERVEITGVTNENLGQKGEAGGQLWRSSGFCLHHRSEGAPSFAYFAKGGKHTDCCARGGWVYSALARNEICFRGVTNPTVAAASPPTLAKSARIGHPRSVMEQKENRRQKRWATRPDPAPPAITRRVAARTPTALARMSRQCSLQVKGWQAYSCAAPLGLPDH